MIIHPFQAQYPITDLISSPDLFTENVKHEYNSYVQSGYYSKTASDGLYICKITSKFGTHIGLIAANDSQDLEKGHILKHENTLEAKEQSMITFLLQTRAMVKPVLLAHPPIDELEQKLEEFINENEPFLTINFKENTESHHFWSITDGVMINEIQDIFQHQIPKCYIADGHHRCSSTVKLIQSAHLDHIGADLSGLLCVYFPFDQLNILDYNRCIDILNEIPSAILMAKLSVYFKIKIIKTPIKSNNKGVIILTMEGTWYKLKWKKKILAKYKNEDVVLDADLLNLYVLKDILDIQDIRSDKRISYIEGEVGIEEITKMMKTLPTSVTFLLYPVSIYELVKIADNHETLPPKSTWFEPRIKSGLIVKEF